MKNVIYLFGMVSVGVACANVDAKARAPGMAETTIVKRDDAALRADAITKKEVQETMKLEHEERRAELQRKRASARAALLERARTKEPDLHEMLNGLAHDLLRRMLLEVPKQTMRAITQAERAHRAMTRAQRRRRLDALQNLLQQIYGKKQVELTDALPLVDREVDFDNEDADEESVIVETIVA